MNPTLLNKVIRFDLLDAYKTENSNNLYFKHKVDTNQCKYKGTGILIEQAVDVNILWMSPTFINFIQNYYKSIGETDGFDNLNYVIQDLTNFFNSENEFLLSQNSHETWNPNNLNFQDYQIKIADDYAVYYWGRINQELILSNE